MLVSNIERAGTTSGPLTRDRAQEFTTGTNSRGYRLNSVEIRFARSNVSDLFRTTNPILKVTIRKSNTNRNFNRRPGPALATLTLPSFSSTFSMATNFTFAAPAGGITLDASTTYFLAVDTSESLSGVALALTRSNNEDASSANGFSIEDYSRIRAVNNTTPGGWGVMGTGFQNDPNSEVMRIRVNGKAILPKASFAISASSVEEDSQERSFRKTIQVNLDEPPTQDLSVEYMLSGTATLSDRGDRFERGKDYGIDGVSTNTGTLTVKAGQTQGEIQVNVWPDADIEEDETVILTLKPGTGYDVDSAKQTHTLTLEDNDVWLSLKLEGQGDDGKAKGAEGDRGYSYVGVSVRLEPAARAVATPYTLCLIAPVATLGTDYQWVGPTSNTPQTLDGDGCRAFSLPAGIQEAKVGRLRIHGDTEVESDERIGGGLEGVPAGVHFHGGALIYTIVNDDGDGGVSDTTAPQVASIVRQAPASSPTAADRLTWRVTFNEAVQNVDAADFSLTGATATLAVARVSNTNAWDVTASGGNLAGLNGTVTLSFASGQNIADTSGNALADLTPTGTNDHTFAVDNTGPPVAQFAASTSSTSEGAGTHNVTVTLDPAPTSAITLRYSVDGSSTATADSDYTTLSGTASVSSGSVTIPVTIIDDNADEAGETVILTLIDGTNYNLGSTTTHTLTITDNDDPPPSTPVVSITAGNAITEGGTTTFTLSASPPPQNTITVTVTIADSGNFASSGQDGPRSVPIGIGGTATLTVNTDNDSTDEPNGRITATIATGPGYSPSNDQASVSVAVADDDEAEGNGGNGGRGSGGRNDRNDGNEENEADQDPTPNTPVAAFANGTARLNEDTGTHDVTVTLTLAPASAIALNYMVGGTATAEYDYAALAGTVAISAGAAQVTIPLTIIDDNTDEANETIILTLTDGTGYTVGATRVQTLTIADNDTAGFQVSPTTVHLAEAGEQATITMRLTSQPTAPVTVTFSSAQDRVVTLSPASVVFDSADWQTPQEVIVTAGADGLTTLRSTVQSQDSGYNALAARALPQIRVRVGADLTALATPWLARFGRTVTGQTVTGITARLSAARTPGLTGTVAGLALDRLGDDAAATPNRLTPPIEPRDPRLNPGGQFVNFRDLLAGSAFTLTSAPSASGGSYALWGQGAWNHFSGQAGVQDVDGNVLSGTLGVDWAQGPWVLGVAVSHTRGDGDSANTNYQGDLESSLTLVTPYVGVDVTEHLSLWGTMGYGVGNITVTLPTEPEVETDTSLFLAAGGAREQFLEPAPTGGWAMALRSEARFLRTTAEGYAGQDLAESEADVGLLRLGLEGSWQQPLADGGSVVPRLDLGFRQDLGDAETGSGLEVQGGIRWEAPAHGLTLDLAGQTLLAHSDREFETWGGSATVQWAADPGSAEGPTLALRQTYGGAGGGGANTFWTENPVALLPTPGPADLRLTADFGWGVPLQAGLGVSHVTYGWAPTSRDISLGWRLLPRRTTALTLDLTAIHQEASRTAPVQGISLSLTRNW